jgi:hypothetical protein
VSLNPTSDDCWQLTFAPDVDRPGTSTAVPPAAVVDGTCQSQ